VPGSDRELVHQERRGLVQLYVYRMKGGGFLSVVIWPRGRNERQRADFKTALQDGRKAMACAASSLRFRNRKVRRW